MPYESLDDIREEEQWGSDNRREAAVINLEVMGPWHAYLTLLLLAAGVGAAVGSDQLNEKHGWNISQADGPYEISTGLVWNGSVDPGYVTYLSTARLTFSFLDTVTTRTSFAAATYFEDDDGHVIAKFTGNIVLICRPWLPRCDKIPMPANGGVYLPARGPLIITFYAYDVNSTVYNKKTVSVQVESRSSPHFIVEVSVRYMCLFATVYHTKRYYKHITASVDRLRPEHSFVGIAMVLLIFYCNPFTFLSLTPRTGGAWDEVVAVLLLQIPPLFSNFLKGAVWGMLASVASREKAENDTLAYPRVVIWVVTLTSIQILYCIFNETAFGTIDLSLNVNTEKRVHVALYALSSMAFCLNMMWIIRVFTGLLGCVVCTSCCGVRRRLRNLPYTPTRDRQLAMRLITILFLSIGVWVGAKTFLATNHDFSSTNTASPGEVFLTTLMMHLAAHAYTPVYQLDDPHMPPSPLTDFWKEVRWTTEWFDWVNRTPGSLCLYFFLSEEEELRFIEMNKTVLGYDEIPFFNYARCLWGCHYAAQAYRTDCLSPTVSGVSAAVAILTAACNGDQVYDTRISSTQSVSWKRGWTYPEPAAHLALLSAEFASQGGYKIIRVIQQNSMQVLLGIRESQFVISFRGSSNLQNWKDDFRVPRVPWDDLPYDYSRSNRNFLCFGNAPLVHMGFLTIWTAISDTVLEAMHRHCPRDATIIVTGHSLGAAIATLASYSIVKHLGNTRKIELWSYGCPLVGNSAFAREHTSVVKRSFRVVNENDLITRMVFTFGNKHVGQCVTLGVGNGMISISPPWFERWWSPRQVFFNSAFAHSIRKYQAAILSSYKLLAPHEDNVPSWVGEDLNDAACLNCWRCCTKARKV